MTATGLYPPLNWRIGGTAKSALEVAGINHTAIIGGIGSDPQVNGRELLSIITAAIADAPRSRQRHIGPSELGIPCNWCLAHKLAGIEETRTGGDWLPAIGTAVHAWLDNVFGEEDAAADLAAVHAGREGETPRWIRESKVDVGEVDGTHVTGNADLYDTLTAEVTDWKICGPTTLRNAKSSGPSVTYRTQAHLYGRGFTRRNLPVSIVRIAYLPRTSVTLQDAVLWSEPYDEAIALAALERANALARAIRTVGIDKLTTGLTRAPDCYSCPRYPNADGSAPLAPGHRAPTSNPSKSMFGN